MTNVEERKAQKVEDATKILAEELVPGTMVYTIRRGRLHTYETKKWHGVDALSVVIITRDGPWEITDLVALVLGETLTPHSRIRVDAGGKDPGFCVVYNLSTVLFPTGFNCTGHENCPSLDHANGDTSYDVHHHTDGEHALRHQWI